MLSPDPILQAPANTQNYNRYSYCLNNPLKYTDPSGYKMAALDYGREIDQYQQWGLDIRPDYLPDPNRSSFHKITTGGGGSGGGGSGFSSWAEVIYEVNYMYNYYKYGGSSNGPGQRSEFESDEEVLLAGSLYNNYHNSWGHTVARSFTNAVTELESKKAPLLADVNNSYAEPYSFNKWLANYLYTSDKIIMPFSLLSSFVKVPNPFQYKVAIGFDEGFIVSNLEVDIGRYFILVGNDAGEIVPFLEGAIGPSSDVNAGYEIILVDFSGNHKDFVSDFLYGPRAKGWIGGGTGIGLSFGYAWTDFNFKG